MLYGRRNRLVLAVCLALCPAARNMTLAQDEKQAEETKDIYRVAEQQKPYFDLLNIEKAWALTRGSPDCLIGVIDTGFDFFHPALKDALQPGYFAAGVYHTSNYTLIAHGTIIASLMCARNVDEDGMVGYSPGCSLLAASIGMPKHTLLLLQQEFMDKNPDAQMTDWQKEMLNHMVEIRKFSDTWLDYVTRCTAEAIDYLVRHDAKVINISAYLSKQLLMRNPTYAKRLDVAFKNAIDNDVVVVIGSGNNNMGVTDYPGTVDSVLVVGASTLADERWELTSEHLGMKITQGSCYGPRLSVMAPSENLLVAEPHDESHYTFQDSPSGKEKTEFEGAYKTTPFGATSCATPVVSSLVALVRSLRPDLPAAEVIRIIKQGAVDIGEDGRDSHTGHGRVDFLKTLTIARDWPAGKRTPGAETEASRDPTPGPQAGG